MRRPLPALFLAGALAANPAAAFSRFDILPVEDGKIIEYPCFARTTFDSGSGELHLVIRVYFSSAGISGAEFYLQGLESLPAGWSATWDAIPPSVTHGNFLGSDQEGRRGGTIAFDPSIEGCLGIYEGELSLIRVDLRAVGAAQDLPQTILRLRATDPPFDPYPPCPMVMWCDAHYTPDCVAGDEFYINPESQSELPPSNPRPGDGAIDVPQDVTLQWDVVHVPLPECVDGPIEDSVQFGTTSDPPFVGMSTQGLFHPPPGRLAPLTTYYWRVCFRGCGPVWSFTTARFVGVSARSWSEVKLLYRQP
jgi:hypothetical protein